MSDQEQAHQKPPERLFTIQRIYLKDVSFETPNSPDIFRGEWKQENNLNLKTETKRLEEDGYEIVLTLTLTVKSADKTAYIVEVQQAGIFTIKGFPEQEMAPMIGAYCPNTLFPYAREAITDLVSKGSFPQMVLQPVNFDGLFMQRQQELAQQQKAQNPSIN